jgi:hypothetical protein
MNIHKKHFKKFMTRNDMILIGNANQDFKNLSHFESHEVATHSQTR